MKRLDHLMIIFFGSCLVSIILAIWTSWHVQFGLTAAILFWLADAAKSVREEQTPQENEKRAK